MQNLPYELFFGEIKDYLKNEVGLGNPYVMVITNPNTGKGAGAAYVEVEEEAQIEQLLTRDGQQVKFGDKDERKLWVNHDPDHRFLKKFCDKNNFDFKLVGHRQRPEIISRSGGGSAPPGGYAPDRPPVHSYGGPPPPAGDDGHGRPLIQNIPDLLASTVFVANLSYRTNEDDIRRHFETVGKVVKCELQVYGDDYEDASKAGKSKGLALVEFARARDAARSIIMYAGRNLQGRDINVRPAKELRALPEGLSELGRPVSEQICVDMCRSSLNVDPYGPCAIFTHNIGFEVTEQQMREVFELVGDVKRCALLTNKETGKSRGNCVVKLATGVDAQQCLNVLHESKFQGRPLRLRLDRDSAGSGPPPPQSQPPMHHASPAGFGNYGAPPPPQQNSGFAQYQPPPPRDSYNQRPPPPRFDDDYSRGRDMYRQMQQGGRQDAPPAQQQPSGGNDKESQIGALASLLGIDANTLNAIRVLQGGNSGSGAQNGNNARGFGDMAQQRSGGAAPPAQGWKQQEPQWKQETNNGNGYRERSPIRRQDSNQQQQQSNQNGAGGKAGKNWNPVTQDTIYLRNLPASMTESRLRYLISQCGQISFIDFPLNRDNTPVGYAYIRFDGMGALDSAKQAIQQYDNYPIEGQRLECGLY